MRMDCAKTGQVISINSRQRGIRKKYLARKDSIQAGIIGAIIGAFVFVAIYGVKILDCTYDGWLLTGYTDLVQHYMGWVSYRASAWHFPIGLIENIVYPDLVSIIYIDSIPLFAIIFKILSPALPETFQYFGMFGLICFILQGFFGSLIIYRLTGRKYYAGFSAFFFVISSVMIQRMYYHTALSAHWIILASIFCWYNKDDNESTVKTVCTWSALSIIALLTEAYFLPMVWGIMFCAFLNDYLHHGRLKICIYSVLVTGCSTIAVGYVMGLFYGNVPMSTTGLGTFSFNLNGFFNSFGTSSLLPSLHFNDGQIEGYSYLGLGIFLLCISCFILGLIRVVYKKKGFQKDYRDIIPHVVFVICFTVVALSPVITCGEYSLTISIPESVQNLWAVFRSTGRMIWPVYYLIIISVLAYIGKWNRAIFSFLFLFAGIALQLLDESDYLLSVRRNYLTKVHYHSSLISEAWKELAEDKRHIMIYPDTFKMYSNYKGEELWIYANRNRLSMSIVYLARNLSGYKNDEAFQRFEQLKSGDSFPDTMYVFIDRLPEQDCGLYYYYIDDVFVGVPQKLSCSLDPMTLEECQNIKVYCALTKIIEEIKDWDFLAPLINSCG